MIRVPQRLSAFGDFALHILVGGLAAAVVFYGAVALGFLFALPERYHLVTPWLHAGADYLERGVWGVDALGYAMFALRELWTLFARLWLGRE